jgi:hypothetical protein
MFATFLPNMAAAKSEIHDETAENNKQSVVRQDNFSTSYRTHED